MKGIIEFTVRLIWAGKRAYARKWVFLGIFAFVFLGDVVLLGKMDLLPELSSTSIASAVVRIEAVEASTSIPVVVSELPVKLEIPKINLSTIIENPTTTDVTILDAELLKGAVRYPTSALLGEIGNVVLFGHSSYLPIVNNKAYKAFNGIQKLVVGDLVTISSSRTAYTYRVKSVMRKNVTYDGIPLVVTGRVLTLVTCDRSLGEATDRSVVVADFVESHAISI